MYDELLHLALTEFADVITRVETLGGALLFRSSCDSARWHAAGRVAQP